LRTFAEWDDGQPGFLEIDLVAHCGASAAGFYLCTLCAVDIATVWVELEAVWGKGQQRVRGSVEHVQARLPMPARGVDSDNGSEFINHACYDYCRQDAARAAFRRALRSPTRYLTPLASVAPTSDLPRPGG
jgi:hypothetical protein